MTWWRYVVPPSDPRRCWSGSVWAGELSAEIGDLVLQLDDPLRTGEGHAFAHQAGEGGDVIDFDPAVAALTAGGAGWDHDTLGVEATDERWLHVQQLGGLADRVERGSGVGQIDGAACPARVRRRCAARRSHVAPAPTGSRPPLSTLLASMDVVPERCPPMSTRRGLACSLTGIRNRRTPSV